MKKISFIIAALVILFAAVSFSGCLGGGDGEPTPAATTPAATTPAATTPAASTPAPATTAPAAGALIVSDNNAGSDANADTAYLPLDNSRAFKPAALNRTVDSYVRIRNTDTKLRSKFLIHSPQGLFEDYQLNPNYDMFVQFKAAGTYTFELYSFDATQANGGTLTPFSESGPSKLTVTVS